MAYATPSALSRDITVRGVDMTVFFYYYASYDATEDEPGFDGEIDIESVFVDEFEVSTLFGKKAFADIEAELWNRLDKGEEC